MRKSSGKRSVIGRRRSEGGFTLVEILIGLFIFAVGVLAVMKMHTLSIQVNGAAKVRSQAVFLAEQRMEELLQGDYASLVSGEDSSPPHRIIWTVAEDPSSSFKDIELRVTWNYRGERELLLHSVKGNADDGT